MGWSSLLVMSLASLASMKAALDRGDVDETSRQGVLAGPVTVEAALHAADRTTRLAGIAAAPAVEDRAELLPALAQVAAGADRRTAIPAIHAALVIARELSRGEPTDDLADADIAEWRDAFGALALDHSRWIAVRIAALETSAALDQATGRGLPHLLGVPVASAFADPDPAFRIAAITALPAPVPPSLVASLAKLAVEDADSRVALTAAATLCADAATDPAGPLVDALGAIGITRVRTLIKTGAPQLVRDAKRCLR